MATGISAEGFIEALVKGLEERDISYAVSRAALGLQLCEIFIEEAGELILIPQGVLNQESIRWILEMRTPIKIRLTIFAKEVTEYRLRVMRTVSDLREQGLEIRNVADAISIQELSNLNLVRLLESLQNWRDLRIRGRPLPPGNSVDFARVTIRRSSKSVSEEPKAAPRLEDQWAPYSDVSPESHADLYVQLRNAIKTYWTQRYLARFLKVPVEKAHELAQRIGIGHEVCGNETLYFFDRAKGLGTYFVHLLKGLLEEMDIRYDEGSNQAFFIAEFNLAVVFFDGSKEQLLVLAEDYARSHDLIIVVPEQVKVTIGRIRDDCFRVIPLTRSHIAGALRGLVRQNNIQHKSLLQTYQRDSQ